MATLGTVTTYTDRGLTPGQAYFYKVAAVNAVAEGGLSNELSATRWRLRCAGSADLTSVTPGNAQVTLAWSAPGSNGGSAITGYNVWRGTTSGGETQVATLANVMSFIDTGRTNGTTYFYRVTARNAVGEGAPSNELSATPVAPPDSSAPSKPGGMDQVVAGTNQQVIDWNA